MSYGHARGIFMLTGKLRLTAVAALAFLMIGGAGRDDSCIRPGR
ncbi:hypothetical protein ACVW0K_003356 [Streptomyces filamentosus]